MSWLARSLATSLKIPDDSGADDDPDTVTTTSTSSSTRIPPPPLPPPPPQSAAAEGVKEDLSELSKTLTRQFWGVANFLAPPPGETSPPPAASPRDRVDTLPEIAGIRSDFAEIGGSFRTGISRISKHKAVSGFSKMASNFFAPDEEEEVVIKVASGEVGEEQGEEARHEVEDAEESEEERVRREVEDDGVRHDEEEVSHESEEERLRHEEEEVEEDWDVIGITDEVLAFARNISRHPETWLDFPLLPDEEESDGLFSYFDMSDAQQEHALAIEHLAPRLAALRIELCPIHMSEECFWKIYFVLLHPRLTKHDAELLSTPQIVEARAMLMQRLQNQSKLESEQRSNGLHHHKADEFLMQSEEDTSQDISEAFPSVRQESASVIPITDCETEKHPIHVTEVTVVDKSVIKEQLPKDRTESSKILEQTFDDDTDDWFDEEAHLAGNITFAIGDEEDVSFSDLEEEDVK